MGLKKAWVYDSSLPDTLAEELRADGCELFSSPGRRASFEEKQAEMERHSLSASGDLVSESAIEWARISVASRGHELKTRMRKARGKNRRSCSSSCFSEEAQRDLGPLDGFSVWPEVGKTGEHGIQQESKSSLYSSPILATQGHTRAVSEPVVINTVDDLLRHLDRIGRLQLSPPPIGSSLMPDTSPVRSIQGSEIETETDAGDSSFVPQSSCESDTSFSDVDSMNKQAPGEVRKDAGCFDCEASVIVH